MFRTRPLLLSLLAARLLVGGWVVEPSNDTARLLPDNQLQLVVGTSATGRGPPTVASLYPLTSRAGLNQSIEFLQQTNVSGALVPIDGRAVAVLGEADIAYASCRDSTYRGSLTAAQAVSDIAAFEPAAIVLFDTESQYCAYDASADESLSGSKLYTVLWSRRASTLERRVRRRPRYAQAEIVMDANNSTLLSSSGTSGSSPSGSSTTNNNILGTSPTTAVAMIILYSITGVITALFLVIIVTGAVRAHRHPERYGPRAGGNGRPRQSRAKGMARAMLETLPIVKFGERDEQKRSADVEMGANAGQPDPARTSSQADPAAAPSSSSDVQASRQDEPSAGGAGAAGHGPAMTSDEVAAVPAPASDGSDEASKQKQPDHGGALGCSICTEDFVKGEDVRVLPCDHKYHPECIDPWLLNVSGTCPLCRIELQPSKDAKSSSRDEGAGSGGRSHGGEGTESQRHSRVSRFMELHLGLTATSEPEERIAALLRLREDRRRGERRRRRTREAEHLVAGDPGAGSRSSAAATRSRSNSRRRSALSGFIRESLRRRVDTPEPPAREAERGDGGAGSAAAASPGVTPANGQDAVTHQEGRPDDGHGQQLHRQSAQQPLAETEGAGRPEQLSDAPQHDQLQDARPGSQNAQEAAAAAARGR